LKATNKNINIDELTCKPFLRWAGGKTWLKKQIDNFLPNNGFNQYHEPFVGSGAIFFHIKPRFAFLSDLNKELIETYISVRDEVESVIEELREFENTKECYYKVRAENYKKSTKRAARFIYLNQTSFNGIYRVNLDGIYNVPYGFRSKDFFEPENLRNISIILQGKKIFEGDFKKTLENIEKGDLVFLDPPYTVTHYNNGFIKYNDKLFDLEAQYALSNYINCINEIGAYYILTNAAHDKIKSIFGKNGSSSFDLTRANLIGGKKAQRGKFKESIFTNVQQI